LREVARRRKATSSAGKIANLDTTRKPITFGRIARDLAARDRDVANLWTDVMNPQRLLGITGLWLLVATCSGCGVIMDTTHRLVVDQVAYNEPADNLLTSARDRILAGSAWREYRRSNPEVDVSAHFECGFRKGFVDHLDAGAVEPPVVPPRKYWKVIYETPEGHEAINDWFTGYRFGVAAAKQSGFRQLVTIPLSVPPEQLAPGQSAPGRYESPPPTEPEPEAEAGPELMPASTLVLPESPPSSEGVVVAGWRSCKTRRFTDSPRTSAGGVVVTGGSDQTPASWVSKEEMISEADSKRE
jgi:hypothetical protein